METETSPPTPSTPINESYAFWKQHIESQKQSGMNRAAYCRENKLVYERFVYWLQKLSARSKLRPIKTLIPVQIGTSDEPSNLTETEIGKLFFPNGCELVIHNMSVLSFILEKLI